MKRVIHGPKLSHPSIVTSLTNLAHAYQEFGQLQKAVVIHEQSLNGTDAAHPETVYYFSDLSNVHALLGSVQKANHHQEKSFKMSRVISYRTSATAQRDFAANNEGAIFL